RKHFERRRRQPGFFHATVEFVAHSLELVAQYESVARVRLLDPIRRSVGVVRGIEFRNRRFDLSWAYAAHRRRQLPRRKRPVIRLPDKQHRLDNRPWIDLAQSRERGAGSRSTRFVFRSDSLLPAPCSLLSKHRSERFAKPTQRQGRFARCFRRCFIPDRFGCWLIFSHGREEYHRRPNWIKRYWRAVSAY